MTFLNKLFSYLPKPKTNEQLVEEYLSKSIDLVDLERRQRLIDRRPNLRAW